jgi:DNA (cytosine-5)-methyltransferase 1
MRYGSICSGIEAATVAWHPLGWKPSFFSEIDKAPRKVLAHHYPAVPCHGDFTTIGANDYDAINLLVGGTPCQAFSVAGLRKGFADDRGNLTLEFIRLAERLGPKWLVWENVPGVLSIDRGRAFGSFLGGLGQLGYGFAYRVLDAQYFGVPQRRRRVFVVGYLGDWRPAAAVFFERESLRGDITPSREAGQRVAGAIAASSFTGGAGGRPEGAAAGHFIGSHWDGDYPHPTIGRGGQGGIAASNQEIFSQRGCGLVKSTWPAEIAPTLNASFGEKQGLENQHINEGGGAIRARTPRGFL